jgi:hypothetical protein
MGFYTLRKAFRSALCGEIQRFSWKWVQRREVLLMNGRESQFMQPNDGMVRVRGAREHNLKNVDLAIPRDSLVVFTGVPGSGKSSLAFGTLYAEAQRRYLAICKTALPSVECARSGVDRRPASRSCIAATAQVADDTIIGGQRDNTLEPAAHAVLTRRKFILPDSHCCTPSHFLRTRLRDEAAEMKPKLERFCGCGDRESAERRLAGGERGIRTLDRAFDPITV